MTPIGTEKTVEFSTFLAHEVRNHLATIRLSTEVLKREDNNRKRCISIIELSSKRINDLITELLEFQQTGEIKEEISSLSIAIDEVLDIVDGRVKLKGITIIKNILRDDIGVFFNKTKIKIALTNIIVNAIEAMPSASGVLKLTLKPDGGRHLLQIEDNGCGISKDDLEYIFNGGFTKKAGGLGFGLRITKIILQSNDIELMVDSKEGKWTRFSLWFNDNSKS